MLRAFGASEADLPIMPASKVLQYLYSFDISSSDFSRHLYRLIRYDEEEQFLSSLQGPELVRLVDFLDQVCTLFWPFLPVAKRTL